MNPFQALTHSGSSNPDIFWGEIAPCEHMVQIYETENVFFDTLEGFVSGGLDAGDAVILITTPQHLGTLETRLRKHGHSLNNARARDQYIALDANETLSRFMVDGWPDEELFEAVVMDLLVRARGKNRRVRAFGEMVAVLWERGDNGATVRLEHLWHQICHREAFSLFCAYPRCGFTQDAEVSMKQICDTHSKVIAG